MSPSLPSEQRPAVRPVDALNRYREYLRKLAAATSRAMAVGNLIQTLFAICSAVRNAKAARVSVGLAVAPVGNVPLPTK